MLYTVGEMAKVLGIPASTLRYYDKEGLLPFVERSSGGIRMFTEKDYEWLKVIECLKESGLSIKDIKSFIGMAKRGDESSLTERLTLFQSRRNAVKKQLKKMQEMMEMMEMLKELFPEGMNSEGGNPMDILSGMTGMPDLGGMDLSSVFDMFGKKEE